MLEAGVDVWLCCALVPVNGIQRHNKKTNKQVHVFFIFDDQINAAILQNQRDALPRVEWKDLPLGFAHMVRIILDDAVIETAHVFTVDPEARCDSAINNALNIRDVR